MSTSASPLASLTDVLDDAREAHPRWVVVEAGDAAQAALLSRDAVAAAEARGFVPIDIASYERTAGTLAGRTLLLIGSFARPLTRARTALLDAAARSARPHVLLTFQPTTPARSLAVREARSAYAAPHRASPPPLSPEVRRHLDRAGRAEGFQQEGRHAAAERLLRDVAASLVRRDAQAAAAGIFIALGRLLLERGRAAAADTTFDEAATAAARAGAEATAVDARIWQALARADAGRVSEAESMCRAILLTTPLAPGRDVWVRATLARVLCHQHRCAEAADVLVREWPDARDLEPATAAAVEATAVRVLAGTGDLFQAGLRAADLVARMEKAGPLPTLIATTARLRVFAESGHLDLAEQAWRRIAELARETRTPFRGLRARLIWQRVLARAGRAADAQRELRAMQRLQKVAPRGLRRAIQDLARPRGGVTLPSPAPSQPPLAVHLITTVQEEEDDAVAVKRILGQLASALSPMRIDLVGCDAGPVSILMTVGTGVTPRIAHRVLEAGISIESDEAGGRELGVPVRCAGRLVAALVARWPLDRPPAAHAADSLVIAAAIAAPRVDAMLSRSRDVSRAAAQIPELVGTSTAMNDVRRAIERAARAPFAVLIEGESGVGKELAARAIHQLSPRRERAFCDINCAALPDDLLESELFGHAKGAFTGAVADKPGLFEQADGGTLFLDEVADLSPRGQAKLLRVLQQQDVRRVGETFSRKVDVRIVAAANRDMRAEVAAGRFRVDLLFRLDVVHIRIPPLRERPDDIPLLARHCWDAAAARVESRAMLTHGVLAALAGHSWPGNVRELQNVISALAVAAPARGLVRASLLPAAITASAPASGGTLSQARIEFERRFVRSALARAGGSRTRAAAELGLSRQGLLKLLVRLGADPNEPHAIR